MEKAGANACPPVIVGIGIGGSLEEACLLAKKALLRRSAQKMKTTNAWQKWKATFYEKINRPGHRPLAGLGGRVTTLGVAALMKPCHIASLPVAVNHPLPRGPAQGRNV